MICVAWPWIRCSYKVRGNGGNGFYYGKGYGVFGEEGLKRVGEERNECLRSDRERATRF
jgi:hypothetical protein